MASPAVPELKRSYAFDYPDIFGMHQKLSAYMNMNDDLRLCLLKQMHSNQELHKRNVELQEEVRRAREYRKLSQVMYISCIFCLIVFSVSY